MTASVNGHTQPATGDIEAKQRRHNGRVKGVGGSTGTLLPMTSITSTEPVIIVTEEALAKILELRAAEDDPDTLGLRIEVTGVRGADYTYDLAFESLVDAEPDDVISEIGGLPVMVPLGSVERLQGATLDLPSNAAQGGLVLRNPNRPNPLSGKDIKLEGTPEEKVTQLLEEQINPAIASHGGFARLVKVEDDVAFIIMGGGCQGCALSAMTLRQGIETAILEAIPEIVKVEDLTDHDAGENPYYSEEGMEGSSPAAEAADDGHGHDHDHD